MDRTVKDQRRRQLAKVALGAALCSSQTGPGFFITLTILNLAWVSLGLCLRWLSERKRLAVAWLCFLLWRWLWTAADLESVRYREAMYVGLQCLTFSASSSNEGCLDFLQYSLYLPYRILLIMPYRLFRARLSSAPTVSTSARLRHASLLAARVLLWWVVRESLCYIAYIHPQLGALEVMPVHLKDAKLHFGSLCMALGMCFHLTYMVGFGIPSVFAAVDGMEPLKLPTCVARCVDFAELWRGFDPGLYLLVKETLLRPCGGSSRHSNDKQEAKSQEITASRTSVISTPPSVCLGDLGLRLRRPLARPFPPLHPAASLVSTLAGSCFPRCCSKVF